MALPLESVPNFSEGRDQATIDALAEALGGEALLDVHSDVDHNRSVFTLVGEDEALSTRSSPGSRARATASTCDGTRARTRGSARRTSSRSSRSSRRTCLARGPPPRRWPRASARSSASRSSSTASSPTAAGRRSSGAAGPDELQRRIDAGELTPDFGPKRLHASAGAVLIGARSPLIAFNVNLRGELEAAKEVAALVRESGGGFPGVRALGLDLPSAGLVQVSMNVEDWEAAALHDIVARVEQEALFRGATVVGSELVGLMPAGAAAAAAGAMLRIEGFDSSRVLELRLLGR